MVEILNNLNQKLFRNDHKLFGFDDEKELIKKKITNAYKIGESNSLLIVGDSGVGKTKLLQSALKDLENEEDFKKNIIKVQLNGATQNDDKIALKSISKQLKINLNDIYNEDLPISDNVNECFKFILSVLTSGSRESISVLIIIENFDLFLHHHNQLLIYNLFNCVQTQSTPLCVVGVTRRLDVIELMEKRVKSRFSHLQIILTNYMKDFERYLEVTRYLLYCQSHCNNSHKVIRRKSTVSTTDKWNKSVDTFLGEDEVFDLLEKSYMYSNRFCDLKNILKPVVGALTETNFKLTLSHLQNSYNDTFADYEINLLSNLTDIQYILIGIIDNLTCISPDEVTFEAVYKEYQKFCRDNRRIINGKPLMRAILDNLVDQQLVDTKSATTGYLTNQKLRNYRRISCQISRDQLLNSLKKRINIDSAIERYLNFQTVKS